MIGSVRPPDLSRVLHGMLAPLPDLRPLTERHRHHQRFLKRSMTWLRVAQDVLAGQGADDLDLTLQTLLDEVARCEHREELRAILGKPDYAIIGEAFAGTHGRQPDVVECYSASRFVVEIWFAGRRVLQILGYVYPAIRR